MHVCYCVCSCGVFGVFVCTRVYVHVHVCVCVYQLATECTLNALFVPANALYKACLDCDVCMHIVLVGYTMW